jgi:ankyrin repeat protein
MNIEFNISNEIAANPPAGQPAIHAILYRTVQRAIRLALLLALLNLPVSAAETAVSWLQKGLFEEEANQNLDVAIQSYQQVIAQADEQRKLAATAVFRLGECYRKKGMTNEAVAQYQRVLRDFSDQLPIAKLSQQNLAGLGVSEGLAGISNPASPDKSNVDPTPLKTQSDEKKANESQEIERLSKIFKDSPDLINGTSGSAIPLVKAAEGKQLKVVRFLLENKANPNVMMVNFSRSGETYTALSAAVLANSLEMVELLLSFGADPDKGRSNPLCLAAEKGYQPIAEALLNAKADVNFQKNIDGMTPLHLAVKSGHKSMAILLVDKGANLNAPCFRNGRVVAEQGFTSAHYAVQFNRLALLEWLGEKKADLNVWDGNFQTPLQLAAGMDNVEAVSILLKYHAEPNVIKPIAAPRGWATPLLAAIRGSGSFKCVELLLQSGANPDGSQLQLKNQPVIPGAIPDGSQLQSQQLSCDSYPLNAAVTRGRLDLVRLLLQYKAQIAIPDFPPLIQAVDRNLLDIAEELLRAGAPVNGAVNTGNQPTPLTSAVEHGNREMAAFLIKHGADVNHPQGDGTTPLHAAVLAGSTNCVALLAEKANPNVLDSWQRTPLDIALEKTRESKVIDSENKPTALASSDLRIQMDAPRLPGSGRATLGSVTDCEEIAKILSAHGAQAEFSRAQHLSVKYAGREPFRILRKDEAGANSFTLLELASFYLDRSDMPYPDWSKASLRRLDLKSWRETVISCPFPTNQTEAVAWKDVPLAWGDIVEIPERTVLAGEAPVPSLPKTMMELLANLNRKVSIRVHEGKTDLLRKATNVPVPLGPMSIGTDWRSFHSFWLHSVVYSTKALLNTSDPTRVKIVRKQGGATREWTYNLETIKFPNDLWLQDGDEVYIPDREK